jgi:hypothetical protein
LKALPAKYRAPLSGFKGNRGFLPTLRTFGSGFDFVVAVIPDGGGSGAQNGYSFCLAGFATLGLILELLVVKEQLLPGSKNEISAAINTLQNLVLKFHGTLPSALGRTARYGA